jgi:ketosteroid isomerase-like protein
VEELLDSEDRVVALFSIKTRSKSGAEVNRRNGLVLTLRDGKIVRWEYYASQDEARVAARIPSSSG